MEKIIECRRNVKDEVSSIMSMRGNSNLAQSGSGKTRSLKIFMGATQLHSSLMENDGLIIHPGKEFTMKQVKQYPSLNAYFALCSCGHATL